MATRSTSYFSEAPAVVDPERFYSESPPPEVGMHRWIFDAVAPPDVASGDLYEVRDLKPGVRVATVIHQDFSWTRWTAEFNTTTYDVTSIKNTNHAPPVPDPSKLKEVSHRIGPAILERAHRSPPQATPGSIVDLLRQVKGAVASLRFGEVIYENFGNASFFQKDEIRPGDIVWCEDAQFQGSRTPLQRYHKHIDSFAAIVQSWDGTKRKLHLADSKKDTLRLGDLRSGVVRIYRPLDKNYILDN